MATAVVLSLPEHGHMNAIYPVIAELTRRGERVIAFGTEPYRAAIEQAGATYTSYGEAERFRPPVHTSGLYGVMAHLMGLAEEVLPALLHRLRADPPDYLLIDSMCVWGHLAQQVLGTPAATLGSVFVPDDRQISTDDLVAQAYGNAPKAVLLQAIDALNTYIETSRRVDRRHGTHSPDLVQFFAGRQKLNIIFTSQYFHLAGDRYDDSYRFVGPSIATRAGGGELPSGPGPLVYISMGTIFNDLPEFYRACYEALGATRYRVVLVTGGKVDRQSIENPPENFTVMESAAQLQVLERASVFVTHGGMNSANEALWNGVPLLVFPQHGDQHLVASRVSELGAGLALGAPEVAPRRIRDMVERLDSEPGFRVQAAKIAESFRSAGGYRRAADEIFVFRNQQN
ncbi:MAG TPA: macrolide family glycosyltransferase [Bryobacteraceae bacterium]|nr:macrolide family glycosyltransferase [Bryobacteraceae bacterium]